MKYARFSRVLISREESWFDAVWVFESLEKWDCTSSLVVNVRANCGFSKKRSSSSGLRVVVSVFDSIDKN